MNPKEYYEKFNNHSDNKKHKGLKKSTGGMDFDSYSARLSDYLIILMNFQNNILKDRKKISKKDFKLLTNLCK